MLGWLGRKAQNSRVYMCIKELKWTLESADQVERSAILAMAQLFRLELFQGPELPQELLNDPFVYSREDLMKAYEVMEDARNQTRLELAATKRSMANFGLQLPSFSEQHAKRTERGMEVWMCTVGVGICADRRDDVRGIWSLLAGSSSNFEKGVQRLREVEAATVQMTGGVQGATLFALPDAVWVRECEFVPRVFLSQRSLN